MVELVVPTLGESITEAVIARWLKQVGERAAADEPVVDLETDKVTVQLPAPVAGVIQAHRAAEGATVTVGQVIGHIDPSGSAASARPAPSSLAEAASLPAPMATSAARLEPQPAAPAETARKPLRQVAAEAVAESARAALTPSQRRAQRARRTHLAVARAAAPAVPVPVAAAPTAARPPAPLAPRQPDGDDLAPEVVVPMSPLRRRIAERLVQAQQTAAILTTFNEVDMSRVIALRQQHKDAFTEAHGVKLGFMSFFVKAAVAALELIPGLNAEIRDQAIVYKRYYHIGVAVGGGKGLVVPVLRYADQMTFAEIESEIADLAGRAKQGTLTLDDLGGGTFTISNGGIYGSMMSTPLLNFPQTGILGMHNILRRPVAVGDGIELAPMMYIALSYDHRVVDGREAVQFLIAVKDRVENPDRLMLDL
jgi:2-oxoglutarate dehydrogenase E2 component (dihydrolipoamide succinyltransferase)